MKRQGIVRNATIALVSAFMMWSSTSCSSSNAASAAETSSVPEQSSSAPESASQAENSSETENTDKSTLKTVSLGYPGNNGCCDGLFGYIDVKGILEEELNKAGYTADSIGFSGGGAGINEALASEAIQVGVYTDIPGIVARSGGVKTTVFAINSSYTGLEIVTKEDDIRTIEDLKGKKVAYTVGNVNHRFLITALQSAGLTINDIEAVTMTAAEGAAAVETGDVDALAAVEIYTGRLQLGNEAYHAVASTRNNPEWSSPYIIVGLDSFLSSEPDAADAIVRALIRGKEAAIADPDDFYSTLAEAHSFDLSLQKYLEDVDGGTFDTKSIKIDSDIIGLVRKDYEFLRENDLASGEYDVDSWFDTSVYERAAG